MELLKEIYVYVVPILPLIYFIWKVPTKNDINRLEKRIDRLDTRMGRLDFRMDTLDADFKNHLGYHMQDKKE